MGIDGTIYVNRPESIDLDEDVVDFADFSEAIRGAASGATEISILGGYYNTEALVDLCKQVPRTERRNCRVRIAVGLESVALIPRTWRDMESVDQQLRKAGFRQVAVAVVTNSPVHFHTKLFRILRTTHPVWFIGSANPGSKRHELMIRFSGRHEALSGYVDAVFDRALVVSSSPPPVEIRTLRDFFLTGMLCHKPPVQRLFTFDAFRLTSGDRDRLVAVLAGEAGVEYARPRTEGFGFSLRSALGIDDATSFEEDEAIVQRTHYRQYSVDTVLGFWMPNIYARNISNHMEINESARLQKLEKCFHMLTGEPGQNQVRAAFKAHVASMERLLTEHSIEVRPVQDRDLAFERFLRSRMATLENYESRIRLARLMTLTPMPDIWDDARAVRDFLASFFGDLAYRLGNQPGSGGRVVRSFVAGLELDCTETAEGICDALEQRLLERPWAEAEWED